MMLGIFAALAGILLFSTGVSNLPPAIVYTLYLAATALTGGFTGFQFTRASLSQTGSYAEISGNTYSYDLFGSALGALVMTLYLVPELGIVGSAVTLSLLNLVFGFCLTLRKNS